MKSIFKLEFNLSTLLTLITIVVSATTVYNKIDSRQAVQEKMLEAAYRRIDQQDVKLSTVIDNQTRLTTLLEERTRPRL